jgi:hypothetical protein
VQTKAPGDITTLDEAVAAQPQIIDAIFAGLEDRLLVAQRTVYSPRGRQALKESRRFLEQLRGIIDPLLRSATVDAVRTTDSGK